MRVAVLGLAIATMLAGCAGEGPAAPSFAGLSSIAHSEDYQDGDERDDASVLARVPSNKVLGAMAFQKATGRTIDPTRLSTKN